LFPSFQRFSFQTTHPTLAGFAPRGICSLRRLGKVDSVNVHLHFSPFYSSLMPAGPSLLFSFSMLDKQTTVSPNFPPQRFSRGHPRFSSFHFIIRSAFSCQRSRTRDPVFCLNLFFSSFCFLFDLSVPHRRALHDPLIPSLRRDYSYDSIYSGPMRSSKSAKSVLRVSFQRTSFPPCSSWRQES